MKTRKNIYFKVVALAAIAIAFAMPAITSKIRSHLRNSIKVSMLHPVR